MSRYPLPSPWTLRLLALQLLGLSLVLGLYDVAGHLIGVNLRDGEGVATRWLWKYRLAGWLWKCRRGAEVKVRRTYFWLKRRGAL